MSPVINFDALSYVDTAPYVVKHPDPKVKIPLGTITVAGPAHPQVLAFEEIERRRELEELQDYQIEAKEAVDAGTPIPRTPEERRTVAEIRVRNASRLAARVISADFTISFEGHEVELTRETAGDILASPKIGWLYEGLFGFVRKRENFMPTSA